MGFSVLFVRAQAPGAAGAKAEAWQLRLDLDSRPTAWAPFFPSKLTFEKWFERFWFLGFWLREWGVLGSRLGRAEASLGGAGPAWMGAFLRLEGALKVGLLAREGRDSGFRGKGF